MNELTIAPQTGAELYRQSTDAAELCRKIVLQTAMEIQKRKYVKVEGWQAIAIAHGCTAGSRDVENVEGGVRAIGEVRRMSDGALIAQAEGFVGTDEPTWYGGETQTKWGKKVLPKRADYAIRAMAQTRAISRACRSAFAHVVVMIDAGLSTTPAEEVPYGGFDDRASEEPKVDRAAIVGAAKTAIGICSTRAECRAWLQNTSEYMEKLGKDDPAAHDEIAIFYKQHFKGLPADDAGEPASPAPAPSPKSDEFEFDDEIPF